MEADLPDEEFLNSIYPASRSSAVYLQRILKSKQYDPDNIFNQFFLSLSSLLGKADFPSFLLTLFQSLKEISVPPIISKKLLLSLDFIHSNSPEKLPFGPLKEVFSASWRTVEIEILDILFKFFQIEATESELYIYAEEQWRSQDWKKAVFLSSRFGFAVLARQEKFEEEFFVLDILIKRDEIDLVQMLIRDNKNLSTKAVKKMCTNKHCKIAGKIVENAGLDPRDFPSLVERLSKSSIRYFLNVDDMSILQLIDLVQDCPEMLAYVAEDLEFQGKKVKNSWQSSLAAWISATYPECPIRGDVKKSLNSITPRAFRPQPDEFGPLQREFDMTFPLPEDFIHFISRPDQISSIVFPGELIGIDCEWRPSIVKFQKFNVSIIQIACSEIVYIIDLISLNTYPELNEKLEQLMQGNQLKIGVSFEGDRRMLIQSYPHLSAFTKPLKNYIDLVSAYGKVFGQSPGGLAGTCELVLKKGLCKHEQRSNWERRPLRQSQLHYAALDAYVQIVVLEELVQVSSFSPREFVEESKKFPSRGIGCDDCGSKTHNKADCVRGKRCKICYKTGHKAANCPR